MTTDLVDELVASDVMVCSFDVVLSRRELEIICRKRRPWGTQDSFISIWQTLEKNIKVIRAQTPPGHNYDALEGLTIYFSKLRKEIDSGLAALEFPPTFLMIDKIEAGSLAFINIEVKVENSSLLKWLAVLFLVTATAASVLTAIDEYEKDKKLLKTALHEIAVAVENAVINSIGGQPQGPSHKVFEMPPLVLREEIRKWVP